MFPPFPKPVPFRNWFPFLGCFTLDCIRDACLTRACDYLGYVDKN